MFSSLTRSLRCQQHKIRAVAAQGFRAQKSIIPLPNAGRLAVASTTASTSRYFSDAVAPTASAFKPSPPDKITQTMAEGIQDSTLFYLRHGVSQQRLVDLANDKDAPLVQRWQRMMEIYLGTQVYVLAGLGYSGDEHGLQQYTQQLQLFIQSSSDEDRDEFRRVGNATWRELLATAFELDIGILESLSIVDARNIMHKVSSKMQEPKILMEIQKRCADLDNPDVQVEVALKHQVLQDIIVNEVYMGGSPCLVEECGFASGHKGYAHLQCVMAEHEADPLIAQYASAAMVKMWEAAGLDVESFQQAGNIRMPGGTP